MKLRNVMIMCLLGIFAMSMSCGRHDSGSDVAAFQQGKSSSTQALLGSDGCWPADYYLWPVGGEVELDHPYCDSGYCPMTCPSSAGFWAKGGAALTVPDQGEVLGLAFDVTTTGDETCKWKRMSPEESGGSEGIWGLFFNTSALPPPTENGTYVHLDRYPANGKTIPEILEDVGLGAGNADVKHVWTLNFRSPTYDAPSRQTVAWAGFQQGWNCTLGCGVTVTNFRWIMYKDAPPCREFDGDQMACLKAPLCEWFDCSAECHPAGSALEEAGCAVPSCVSTTPSHVGQAILNLGGYDTNVSGHSSVLTQCNSFPTNDYATLHDWILNTPNLWTEPTAAHHGGHDFFNLLTDQVDLMESSLDIANMHIGDLPGDLAPKLFDLNERLVQDPECQLRKPLVRVLYSPPTLDCIEHDDLNKTWKQLTAELPADSSTWKFYLGLAVLDNQVCSLKWNHVKAVIRDGSYAISGGHNWVDSYKKKDPEIPMHDVSISIVGEAASQLKATYEQLWRNQTGCRSNFPNHVDSSEEPTPCVKTPPLKKPLPPPDYTVEPLNVFSLSRIPYTDDYSADDAIEAALLSAQEQINIVAVSLIAPVDYLSERLIGILAKKMWEQHQAGNHSFLVKIAVSPHSDPDSTLSRLKLGMWQHWIGMGVPEWLTDFMLCNNFKFGIYRTGEGSDIQSWKYHGKTFVVDGNAFYVGSQNLHPGEFRENDLPMPMQLANHGYLVDDEAATSEFNAQFAERVWDSIEQHPKTNLLCPVELCCPWRQ